MEGPGEMTVRQRLGRNIVRAREERGWLQTDLAKRLGISRARLSKWEKGEHAPPLAGLADLGRVLEKSLDALVLGAAEGEAGTLTQSQREKVREALEALESLSASLGIRDEEVTPSEEEGAGGLL
jgi:transcriptional regulator with XRE-family HTH domain